MKALEAINCIDDVLNSEYHYDESLGYQLTSDDFEWLEKSKDALEKQMPKHIEEQTEDDREFIDYVCPNCKTTLQQKMKGATRTTIYKYKYCIFCGQSLDWSDLPTEKGGEEE
ncbi:MAG: hypothetical protein IKK94_07030 [Clostridia bacterium]|nr:hypothetical protein [Clostridia bacterium]